MSYFVKTVSTSNRTKTTKCHNLATAQALVRGLQEQGKYRSIQLSVSGSTVNIKPLKAIETAAY